MQASLTPSTIVAELDKYIVGQSEAKKSVAIALRNRWRRLNASEEMRAEIMPNNILMIGSTGVGKTEIARRLAQLVDAPFIKVEASKFTEVGYVGRDVESMVRDLLEQSINVVRALRKAECMQKAAEMAEETLLDEILSVNEDDDEDEKAQRRGVRIKRVMIVRGEMHVDDDDDDDDEDDEDDDDEIEAINEPPKPGPAQKNVAKIEIEAVPAIQSEKETPPSEAINEASENTEDETQESNEESGEDESDGRPTEQDIENAFRAFQKIAREKVREKLRSGEMDDFVIELEIAGPTHSVQVMGPAGMEGLDGLQEMLSNMIPHRRKKRKMTVAQAREHLIDEEAQKLIDMDAVTREAIERAEHEGVIFIDEIDKIASTNRNTVGADVSREGVQRDLLPIVEGAVVKTRYGSVRTDHILFIAAGAFHVAKPSDLIPELQGRFPIRVELTPLTQQDFVQILTQPRSALVKQYQALLAAEGVSLLFEEDAIKELATIAYDVNQQVENIGARRLHTIMSNLLDTILFEVPDKNNQTEFTITRTFVEDKLKHIARSKDLSRFIL